MKIGKTFQKLAKSNPEKAAAILIKFNDIGVDQKVSKSVPRLVLAKKNYINSAI